LVILFISLFIALYMKLDPGTHKGTYSILVLKLGVTKVVIRAMFAVGLKPRVDCTLLRIYS
jgi:hypothetical protein